jgi:hypothetical protein
MFWDRFGLDFYYLKYSSTLPSNLLYAKSLHTLASSKDLVARDHTLSRITHSCFYIANPKQLADKVPEVHGYFRNSSASLMFGLMSCQFV